jgi:toxin ParE1/3/4
VSLALRQSDYFGADLARRVDWYREHASPEIAERFVDAVQDTLHGLAQTPGMGRPRFADWPELAGLHSWRVNRPFQRHLIFYRFKTEHLLAERLIHGARDLPRRLLQSPYEQSEE